MPHDFVLRAGSTDRRNLLQTFAPWFFRVVRRNFAGLLFTIIPTNDLVVFFIFYFFGREVQFAFLRLFANVDSN